MQDRIRAIANALGLQTIMWKYDSLDWQAGVGNFGPADVDANYQLFVNNLTAGTFNTVGGILLTHELNNFTMQEAINWYPKLKSTFSVRYLFLPLLESDPRNNADIYTSTLFPLESRSTRRTRTRRPTIPCRRLSNVRS